MKMEKINEVRRVPVTQMCEEMTFSKDINVSEPEVRQAHLMPDLAVELLPHQHSFGSFELTRF